VINIPKDIPRQKIHTIMPRHRSRSRSQDKDEVKKSSKKSRDRAASGEVDEGRKSKSKDHHRESKYTISLSKFTEIRLSDEVMTLNFFV